MVGLASTYPRRAPTQSESISSIPELMLQATIDKASSGEFVLGKVVVVWLT